MKDALQIFRFLHAAATGGERTVLVTLTDVIGRSSRAPGTHMAVAASGSYVGSLSGGCVEAAVVAEALDVLDRGVADLVRFGAGSRYIDIRLPCGGAIELLFAPDPPAAVVAEAIARLERREPATLSLGRNGSMHLTDAVATGWSDDRFIAAHLAELRVVIVGHGAETVALARLAKAYSAAVQVLSPDREVVSTAVAVGAEAKVLPTPGSTDALVADERTAIVFLFHDHDWEADLMSKAVATPAFFIGAMGSRRTHERRCDLLVARGASTTDVSRITGPIGLIPAARDPDTLALSVLSQIAGLAACG